MGSGVRGQVSEVRIQKPDRFLLGMASCLGRGGGGGALSSARRTRPEQMVETVETDSKGLGEGPGKKRPMLPQV